jgi:hypothetical protein
VLPEFKLPKEAFVNKLVAKSKFYDKADLSRKIQDEFAEKINKIYCQYVLAERTIGIAKTDKITEIVVFQIELKEQVIPKKLIKIIDATIPYPILYCFVHADHFAYGIALKENTAVTNYYFSEWDEELQFDFTGIDLEKVYQKLVKAFIRRIAPDKGSFEDIVGTDNQIRLLENEITALERKISAEKQFNRKVEINKVLLSKKERRCNGKA